MSRGALVALLLVAAPARADRATLDAARAAVATVRYDDAQRLLGDALAAGDLGPDELAEVYRLSAQTAVVLGDPALAEQLDRRWLAIAPDAALSADAAPKLRAPFAAARAYLAAHGGLVVRTRRVAGALEVSIGNDPLHMAVAVRALDLPAIATPLAGDAPARLAPVPARLAILDEHGNHLRELAIAPVELAAPRAWRERPLTWIVPAVVLAGVAGGAFALAVRAQHDADAITADSAHHRLADADHALGRARGFAIAGGIAAAGALGLGTVGAVVAVRF